MITRLLPLFVLSCLFSGNLWAHAPDEKLAERILENKNFHEVFTRGSEILRTGFNAGSGYSEVWIRDLNTFITYACRVRPSEEVRNALMPFFHAQGFDENEIYYHGGTAVAIEAGLLSPEEVLISLNKMRDNVTKSGAQSIGLTLYPPYPQGSFHNEGMNPYSYQNGGDWTWFGGRMITQLIEYGYIEEAYTELQPFVDRVVKNDGFFEWYTIEGKPHGSGVFRGSAGVLMQAIEALQNWAREQQTTQQR